MLIEIFYRFLENLQIAIESCSGGRLFLVETAG
jgi:hypothetical protein